MGLLPISDKVMRVASFYTVELGLVLGVLLIVLGLGASIGAVAFWKSARFGVLDPTLTMRIVIPSVSAIILGLQMAFGSFMFGILSLETRRPDGSQDKPRGRGCRRMTVAFRVSRQFAVAVADLPDGRIYRSRAWLARH